MGEKFFLRIPDQKQVGKIMKGKKLLIFLVRSKKFFQDITNAQNVVLDTASLDQI